MSKYRTKLKFRIYVNHLDYRWSDRNEIVWIGAWSEYGQPIVAYSPWDAGIKARVKYPALKGCKLQFREVRVHD